MIGVRGLKLGFDNEVTLRPGNPYYACQPVKGRPEIVAVVWKWGDATDYMLLDLLEVRRPTTPPAEINIAGSKSFAKDPLKVYDALEAQLAIFHLIQTHLPTEVTENEAA